MTNPATDQSVHQSTRIAPTPSGFLHLGNAWSFAVTAAMAHREGAEVLLRIDDLDQQRVTDAYVQDVFDTLDFLQIPWQKGPANAGDFRRSWSQVRRLQVYNATLQQLVESGKVFACNCSRSRIAHLSADGAYPGTCLDKQLPLDGPDVCWRLDTTGAPNLPAAIRHFIVRKKDSMPSYQLASVADDLYYQINMIVRGQDLYPSTQAQQYLASLLPPNSFIRARFYHHPLLLSPDGSKLSKSSGATSIQYLRRSGNQAADIYRLLGRLFGIPEPVRSWQCLLPFIDTASATGICTID